jgi:hypothetical protein
VFASLLFLLAECNEKQNEGRNGDDHSGDSSTDYNATKMSSIDENDEESYMQSLHQHCSFGHQCNTKWYD